MTPPASGSSANASGGCGYVPANGAPPGKTARHWGMGSLFLSLSPAFEWLREAAIC